MNMTTSNNDNASHRRHMIDGHLLPNDVTDENVIDAIEQINREAFLPASLEGVAYIDKSIKVADGRYLMEPLAFAKLLSAADIQKNELVLDIAPATGYSSAVLSKIVDAVVAIEENSELADKATSNLADQGCDNVAVVGGSHVDGLAKQGPYDLIFIGGMIDEVPQALLDQLNEKGRILCVLNQDGFGRAVLITYNDKIMGITPAMPSGSSMNIMMKAMPDRAFDVGIAEQHAVTFSAGLATQGLVPFCNIYSTFMQRAFDQVVHDVAIQNLPVRFAIDRAGLVGADGPTHQGAFDISFLRCIPNMVIMTPSDENECRQMLYTGHQLDQPATVRYPRGGGDGVEIIETMSAIPLGQSRTLRSIADNAPAQRVAILNFGTLLPEAKAAAEQLNATLIDMRFVKPLDTHALTEAAAQHDLLVTLEDGAIKGGAGSEVGEYILANGLATSLLQCGLPDTFIMQATQTQMYAQLEIDAAGIVQQVQRRLATS